MKPVRVLRNGLTDAGLVYKAGDVVTDPSPALYELAVEGRMCEGKLLAEVIEQPKAVRTEPQPAPPEPEVTVEETPVKKGRRK
jgi:hypothetical protein